MQPRMKLVGVVVLGFWLTALWGFAQEDPVAGVWRGHSTCMVKDSPCRDEVNVYRISQVAGKPGLYSVSGDKVVDGKEVVMGVMEWRFDPETHTLNYEFPRGVFRLTLTGRRLDGTLKLPDGTLYRQIYLEKAE